MQRAVFAGSFDPFTVGHLDLVRRAAGMFDQVTVLVGFNPHKSGFLTVHDRVEIVQLSVQGLANVDIDSTEGLTTEYMRTHCIRYLVRGLRNSKDMEWEQSVAWANAQLQPDFETVLLLAGADHMFLSSSVIREMLHHGADVSKFIAPAALSLLKVKCSL